jgi:acylphosphatase
MVRKRIIYRGRVQGVGFRATAQWVARGRPVTGWVRNEPDGTVLLEVQGTGEAVEDYIAALGRTMARNITGEHVTELPPVEGERGFEVTH